MALSICKISMKTRFQDGQMYISSFLRSQSGWCTNMADCWLLVQLWGTITHLRHAELTVSLACSRTLSHWPRRYCKINDFRGVGQFSSSKSFTVSLFNKNMWKCFNRNVRKVYDLPILRAKYNNKQHVFQGHKSSHIQYMIVCYRPNNTCGFVLFLTFSATNNPVLWHVQCRELAWIKTKHIYNIFPGQLPT